MLDEYIELNMANYDEDQVCQLNAWAIGVVPYLDTDFDLLECDNEEITPEWLARRTKKEPYVYAIIGTNFFLHHTNIGWDFIEQTDDGDEITWCCVRTIGELRRMTRRLCGIDFPVD
jgi:hypothetical protein